MEREKLPVGLDSFEKIRRFGFYYVDKTPLIKDLLTNWGDVNLFTRPRRFGKTLNMNMLKSFFEIGSDKTLFDGLAISREARLCEEYQSQYPVVFLTLKGVEGRTFDDALQRLAYLVASECKRLSFLENDAKIDEDDRSIFRRLKSMTPEGDDLQASLVTLSRMLRAHYGRQVILLIDEYDVPLDKANAGGYYDQMISFMRGFFGDAFKTNPDLHFAVVTGCLRISKESIFTGINNLKVDTITDKRYDESFGFTDEDVRRLLEDYDLSYAYENIKAWYDGYHFGDADVYCPWDVMCHCDKLLADLKARPKPYWNNTSSNEIVRQFIGMADATTREEIEHLVAGESIRKKIVETLTYGDLMESIDNLWSVLFLTGYLTADRHSPEAEDGLISLVIPNREVKEIFIEKIQKWFRETRLAENQKGLYDAVWSCDSAALEERLRNVLLDTISYYDYHENYYHALLVGLVMNDAYRIRSNAEMGEGRSDIVIEDDRGRRAVIIEVKRAADYDLLKRESERAIRQIKDNRYAWPYQRRKYTVTAYGIAFADKDCCVVGEVL